MKTEAPENTLVLDLGKKSIERKEWKQRDRYTRNKGLIGLVLLSIALVIVYVMAFTIPQGKPLIYLIPIVILGGIIYEIRLFLKFNERKEERKTLKTWLLLAKKYGGSIYRVYMGDDSKDFFSGRKSNYFIFFPLPHQLPKNEYNTKLYLNSLLVTKHRKEAKLRGTQIEIVKEKEIWTLFRTKKVEDTQDIKIGDPEFDSQYVIRSNQKENCKRFLDSSIRDLIQQLVKGKFGLKISDEGVCKYIELREKGVKPKEMDQMIEKLYKITRRLDRKKRVTLK